MLKQKKYEYILLDLDDTLLDFKRAEVFAFSQLLAYLKLDDQSILNKYHAINNHLWHQFELGQIKKEVLATLRFKLAFENISSNRDYEMMNQIFLSYIALASYAIDGCYELLKYLKPRYKVYIISNGIKQLQLQRLNLSRIMEYIDGFVFSEETLKPKPDLSYFEHLFNKYDLPRDPQKYLIIGDSESSDIMAATNLKIDSIYFNPKQLSPNIKPTYQVQSLLDIIDILKE
jgi:2-haloacid dehalogenase